MRSFGWANRLRTVALILGLAGASSLAQVGDAKGTDGATKAAARAHYRNSALHFEPNRGQTDGRVDFLSRGSGYTLFLASTEAVLALGKERSIVRMRLENADRASGAEGSEPLPGKSHYLIGSDRKSWRTGVPHYARVLYRDVYPGIDLVYYGNQGRLEHDFIVAPGADPGVIRIAFEGLASPLRLDENGDLVADWGAEELRIRKPQIYQEIGGVRQSVAGGYTLVTDAAGDAQVAFRLAAYDPGRTLVIDPVLEYSHYLGGTLADFATDVAVDASGNVYLTGGTDSVDFPGASGTAPKIGVGGGRDVFVTKLDAAGQIEYSTYIGGRGTETGNGIAVVSGHAYVTGSTSSLFGFPGPGGNLPQLLGPLGGTGINDAFVVKLKADGSDLELATLVGGSDDDQGHDIAVIGGKPVIVGSTSSRNFPTDDFSATVPARLFAGVKDAFVTKLDFNGFFEFSTCLGGNNVEDGFGIAAAGAGSVYVTGQTCSGVVGTSDPNNDFPTANAYKNTHQGGCDAFVTKVSDSSGITYSTYLGGGGWDRGTGIAADSLSKVYVTGETSSSATSFPVPMSFPTTTGAVQPAHGGGFYDAFVTKLDTTQAGLNQLVYSTYLGGTGDDFGGGIAVDAKSRAHVTGNTMSATGFPLENPLPQGGSYKGGSTFGDAFVTKLELSGSLSYSTYLGGASDDIASGIAVDFFGGAYVVGGTVSTDFPGPATPLGPGGGGDAFVAKIVAPCTGGGPFAYVLPYVIDTADDCLVETIAGSGGTGVAVGPDGAQVYAAKFETVSFINPVTKVVNDQTPMEADNVSLQGAAVTPDGTRLWVTAHTDAQPNKLFVFDTQTAQLLEVIQYDADDPMAAVAGAGLVFHPDGTKLYVANNHSGTLDVIDAKTKSKIASISLNLPGNITGAWGIAITPDGKWVYVGGGFNNDTVSVVDVTLNTFLKNIAVAGSRSLAVTPKKIPGHGYFVYVVGGFDNPDLAVIDTATQDVVPGVPNAGGDAVAVTPDGKKVYVADGDLVKVIDVDANAWVDSVLLPDFSGVSLGSFIGPQDRDGDGINDQIDGTWDAVNNQLVPNTAFSNTFTDQHLGGASSGQIDTRDGLKVTVWKAFNGFYANARGGAGTAVLTACGIPVDLTENDAVKVLCGSLTLEVLSGPIEIRLETNTIVSVPTGGIVKITELSSGQVVIENQGSVAISILDSHNQKTASILPGQSVTLEVCPCKGPASGGTWKNHGEYVSCVEKAAQALAKAGLISEKKRADMVSEAAKSDCGGKK